MQVREDEERGYPKEPQASRKATLPEGEYASPSNPPEKPDGFSEWWAAYPRKIGKRQAERAYKAALKSGATPEELLEALEAHKQNWRLANTETPVHQAPRHLAQCRELDG